ncbi:hypothetical protein EIP86_008135 [Pleurotus ostreatoroseus]|nr:hypothetical protein EIP86_008135 [Pleurotus ostreatoroseus]
MAKGSGQLAAKRRSLARMRSKQPSGKRTVQGSSPKRSKPGSPTKGSPIRPVAAEDCHLFVKDFADRNLLKHLDDLTDAIPDFTFRAVGDTIEATGRMKVKGKQEPVTVQLRCGPVPEEIRNAFAEGMVRRVKEVIVECGGTKRCVENCVDCIDNSVIYVGYNFDSSESIIYWKCLLCESYVRLNSKGLKRRLKKAIKAAWKELTQEDIENCASMLGDLAEGITKATYYCQGFIKVKNGQGFRSIPKNVPKRQGGSRTVKVRSVLDQRGLVPQDLDLDNDSLEDYVDLVQITDSRRLAKGQCGPRYAVIIPSDGESSEEDEDEDDDEDEDEDEGEDEDEEDEDDDDEPRAKGKRRAVSKRKDAPRKRVKVEPVEPVPKTPEKKVKVEKTPVKQHQTPVQQPQTPVKKPQTPVKKEKIIPGEIIDVSSDEETPLKKVKVEPAGTPTPTPTPTRARAFPMDNVIVIDSDNDDDDKPENQLSEYRKAHRAEEQRWSRTGQPSTARLGTESVVGGGSDLNVVKLDVRFAIYIASEDPVILLVKNVPRMFQIDKIPVVCQILSLGMGQDESTFVDSWELRGAMGDDKVWVGSQRAINTPLLRVKDVFVLSGLGVQPDEDSLDSLELERQEVDKDHIVQYVTDDDEPESFEEVTRRVSRVWKGKKEWEGKN